MTQENCTGAVPRVRLQNLVTTVKHAVELSYAIPGGRTPILIGKEMLKDMKNGAVIVDVGVDQGGCIETTKPTTHQKPTYLVDGVVHYCVTNMPGAVSRTSTYALTNATIGYGELLAERGVAGAARMSTALARGINTFEGVVTCRPVAESLGFEYHPLPFLRE